MSARFRLIGKQSSRPHREPSQAILSMDRTNPKNAQILHIILGGPMGPVHPGCCIFATPRLPGGGPAAPRAPSQIFERLRLSSSPFFQESDLRIWVKNMFRVWS